MKAHIKENENVKILRSNDYNFNFDKNTGYFERWGKTVDDDPDVCNHGNEILDIEITTKCAGVVNNSSKRQPCSFCYKSNTLNGTNMTFDEFKTIIDKMPQTCTQIALGADSQGTSNPDMFKMMDYARSIGIIPNLTIADVSDEVADKLSKVAGACAISRYENKNICYDSIKKLTDRGMTQINIHILLSSETYNQIIETLNDRLTDNRLEKLNAIVFLSLKKKGRGDKYTSLTQKQFDTIIDMATALKINYGMDSCSATKFLESIKSYPNVKEIEKCVDKCESSCFSAYISSESKYYPCSFAENIPGWEDGIKITKDTDFIKDVWFNPKTVEFRKKLLENNRNCPLYEV